MYAADPPLSDTRRPSARRRAILTPHAVRPTTHRSKAEDHERGSPCDHGGRSPMALRDGAGWPLSRRYDATHVDGCVMNAVTASLVSSRSRIDCSPRPCVAVEPTRRKIVCEDPLHALPALT